MNQPWKLEEGAKLVRALQPRVSDFGYAIAVGGAVLTAGEAEKLDLYFHPVVKSDLNGLVAWLTTLWGEPDQGELRPEVFNADPNRFSRMIQQAPERWLVRDSVLVGPPQPVATEPVPEPVVTKQTYKQKLVFQRADNDRIDVYIV